MKHAASTFRCACFAITRLLMVATVTAVWADGQTLVLGQVSNNPKKHYQEL